MVAGHHFLFPGLVFFLQDTDVKKRSQRRQEKRRMSARRRLQVLLQINPRRIPLLFSLLFLGLFFFNHCLSCSKPSHRHPVRRATYIGQPSTMAKLDAVRAAEAYAADTELDARACFVSLLHGDGDQLADTGLVDWGKWILLDDFEFLVRSEEGTGIVAAHAKAGLGQVI